MANHPRIGLPIHLAPPHRGLEDFDGVLDYPTDDQWATWIGCLAYYDDQACQVAPWTTVKVSLSQELWGALAWRERPVFRSLWSKTCMGMTSQNILAELIVRFLLLPNSCVASPVIGSPSSTSSRCASGPPARLAPDPDSIAIVVHLSFRPSNIEASAQPQRLLFAPTTTNFRLTVGTTQTGHARSCQRDRERYQRVDRTCHSR